MLNKQESDHPLAVNKDFNEMLFFVISRSKFKSSSEWMSTLSLKKGNYKM